MTALLAPRPEPVITPQRGQLVARLGVGTLLIVAAAIHFRAAADHLDEWAPAGVFFLAVGCWQLATILAVAWWPSTVRVAVTLWSTVGLIGVYVRSRTVGLPWGPVHLPGAHESLAEHNRQAVGGHGNGVPIFPGQAPTTAEDVGTLDLVALGVELALVVMLLTLLPAHLRRRTASALAACGLVMLVLRAAGLS